LPLLGFSKDAPPSYFIGESTPGHRSRARSIQVPFGKRAPTLLHVPSSWFLTTSTVSSSLRQSHRPCGPCRSPCGQHYNPFRLCSSSCEPSRPSCRCCAHVSARFRPWGPPRFRETTAASALSSLHHDSLTSP